MKFGLLLVGEKGRFVLENLLKNSLTPNFVVSYKDKNVSDDAYDSMFKICLSNEISFLSKNDIEPLKLFESVDKVFVIGWQFLLKNNLDKLIVIHDSKLPEYKGWSPTVQYLIDGNPYLAATAFIPTMKMDTGEIYEYAWRNIEYPIKIEKALQIVGELYVTIIEDIIEHDPIPYSMEGAESFCVWRDYEDYFIDWKEEAKRIKRFVDAVGHPFAGAKIKYEHRILTVLDAEVEELNIINPTAGKVWSLDNGLPTVITGQGLLKITKIVDENGNDFKFKKLKTRL